MTLSHAFSQMRTAAGYFFPRLESANAARASSAASSVAAI